MSHKTIYTYSDVLHNTRNNKKAPLEVLGKLNYVICNEYFPMDVGKTNSCFKVTFTLTNLSMQSFLGDKKSIKGNSEVSCFIPIFSPTPLLCLLAPLGTIPKQAGLHIILPLNDKMEWRFLLPSFCSCLCLLPLERDVRGGPLFAVMPLQSQVTPSCCSLRRKMGAPHSDTPPGGS